MSDAPDPPSQPYEPPAYESPSYDGVIEPTHADALPQAIADRVEDLPAADAAHVFEHLSADRAAAAAEILDPETAGRIVARMTPEAGAALITAMPAVEASMVLAEVDPDDRVDLLAHVTGAVHDQLVAGLGADDAAEVRHLEQYPPDTAGGIMTTEVPALVEDLTPQQAAAIRRSSARSSTSTSLTPAATWSAC